jgi:CheY-like chemotaxis protein/putative methionine-R-sulfoxide reductase with GAF domain
MKNVLFVDDEETLLLIMAGRFEEYSDRLNVFTACNGKEAISVLGSEDIDLVVTDLKMPEMDGIELLAFMSHKHPTTPAIVVSAYCTPQIQKTLMEMGALRIMDKTADFDQLTQVVLKSLEGGDNRGSLNGFSVSSFLQILQMEEKTCTLEVHGPEKKRGYLYVVQGELYDAQCADMQGEEAAYAIVAWEKAHFFLRDLPRNRREKKIQQSMMSVVMEGLRRKDEADMEAEEVKSETQTDMQEESVIDLEDGEDIYSGRDDTFDIELGEVLNLFDNLPEGLDTAKPPRDSADGHTPSKGPKPEPGKKKAGNQPFTSSKLSGSKLEPVVFQSVASKCSQRILLDTLLKTGQDKLRVDLAVQASRFYKRGDQLRVDEVFIGSDVDLKVGAFYDCGNSLSNQALKNKRPEVVRLIEGTSTGFEGRLAAVGLKVLMYVPLFEDKSSAVSLVIGFSSIERMNSAAVILDWIAGMMALNYERNRLLYVFARQREALETVEQIGKELGSQSVDMEKLLRGTMEKIRLILNVEAGALYLRDKGELKVTVAFNTCGEACEKYRLKIGSGVAGHVAAKGQAAMVNDETKSSAFFAHIDKRSGFKTRSVLCVPMVTQSWIIGAIEVRNKINGAFTVTDEGLLKPIAAALSALLMNEQLKRNKDHRAA